MALKKLILFANEINRRKYEIEGIELFYLVGYIQEYHATSFLYCKAKPTPIGIQYDRKKKSKKKKRKKARRKERNLRWKLIEKGRHKQKKKGKRP